MTTYRDAVDIIRSGESIRKQTRRIRSADLSPVRDRFSGSTIPNWRSVGRGEQIPIYSMMSRVGGFPAALARYFIAKYSSPGELVLDPFCGKGTTLLEAARLGRRAIGGDVAPDAVVVSRAKCSPIQINEVIQYIRRLDYESGSVRGVPQNVRAFYNDFTLRQLTSIRPQLLRDLNSSKKGTAATFVCAVILGALHGHSRTSLSVACNQCFAMSPEYVRRYVRDKALVYPRRNVRETLIERSISFFPSPEICADVKVHEGSVTEMPTYLSGEFGYADLLVTSPPYFNRQTYVKDSWLRHWFLDRKRSEISAKSVESGSVAVFSAFLDNVMWNVLRAVRRGGHLVFVCGQAKVIVGGKQVVVKVADLLLDSASRCMDEKAKVVVESVISDRAAMSRGSYFAVHGGKTIGKNGDIRRRYGEEEIVVMRRCK